MISEREFESIFNSYFNELRKYLYYKCSDADLATDIAQDVFTKIWEKKDNFTNENIRALLYKMASDNLNSHFRRTKLKQEQTVEFDIENVTPQEEMELAELKEKYENALSALPEKQRVVFLMNRIDQLTYKEIAERLEVSVKAIEKRMSKTIAFFRTRLKQ